MKKFFMTFLLAFMATFHLSALNYHEARDYAWFLTDKMAYELNLTPDQYDRAYQINLEYLMSIDRAADCYGHYWTYRNIDFQCVLFDWQYQIYSTLDYFFRPIRWVRSHWYYPVYEHYRRGHYYFSRPAIYLSYRGTGWKHRGHHDLSPYHGMKFRPGHGMRDRYHEGKPNRPEYGKPGHVRPGRPNGAQRIDGGHGKNDHMRPGRPSKEQPSTRPSRPSVSDGKKNHETHRPSRQYNSGKSSVSRGSGNGSRTENHRSNSNSNSRNFGR